MISFFRLPAFDYMQLYFYPLIESGFELQHIRIKANHHLRIEFFIFIL